MSAQIGDTAWYLVKVEQGGAACDHCNRSLKRLYRVVNPDGKEMTVGSGCVKKITGWTLEWREAQRLLYVAERERRMAVVAAEYPELAAANTDVQNACRAAREEGYDSLSGYARVPERTRTLAAIFVQSLDDFLWKRNPDGWREYINRSI